MDNPSTPEQEPPDARVRRPPSKRTLFCPACDHAAPAGPEGDWLVRERAGGEALACPDCGAVVTVRRTLAAVPA